MVANTLEGRRDAFLGPVVNGYQGSNRPSWPRRQLNALEGQLREIQTLMANVLLGVTGSVAAIEMPTLLAHCKRQRHEVRVVATQAALCFFDPASSVARAPAQPTRP